MAIVNPSGKSPFLLLGDHAGNAIPAMLGDLGLDEGERGRHIGWDIGIAGLGAALSGALDAVFVRQAYSRLVVDCNRRPGAPDAIPAISDGTVVPGNAELSPTNRAARFAAIHEPYQAAIGAELMRRDAAGQPTILIALHSFTPVMRGIARPWEIGILYEGGDATFALAMLDALRAVPGLCVGDNEPYRMDLIDHTIPRHAYPARRRYAEIEIRQDLLADAPGIARWTTMLTSLLSKLA